MPNVVIAILLFLTLATCAYAFVLGDAPERVGATVILVNLFASMANETFLHQQQLPGVAIDGLTAVVLLIMALRYASFWLGVVMLLYALQFALHAYYLVLELPRDRVHVVLNNADFFGISLCLLAGTTMAWMRRRRRIAGPQPEPAP
jgi:hypothetical protein